MCFELQIIKAQSAVYDCSAEVEFSGKEHPEVAPTVNDQRLYEHARRVSTEILGIENVHVVPKYMGSEDFAYYQEKIPGCFFFLGIGNETLGSTHSPHSPYFNIDENSLRYGAVLHAAIAYSYLFDSSSDTFGSSS